MSSAGVQVPVTRVAFVGLTAPDIPALAAHYRETLGLVQSAQVGDSVYLTTGPEHHCVVLESGDDAEGYTRIGMEIAVSIDEAASSLERLGIAAQRRTDPDPGIAEALVISHLDTAPLYLYERQTLPGVAPTLGPRPTKLAHVACRSGNAVADREFLEEVLGFRWSDSAGNAVHFLRCSPNHHSLNLFDSPEQSGLHHIAFEARDAAHLVQICDHLGALGVSLYWGPGRHGPGHNLFTYHSDPAGHLVEISTEMDLVFDESDPKFEPRPWHEDLPQRPKNWAMSPRLGNIWGPLPLDLAQEIAERAAAAAAARQ
jgi:catechol-2,3-dioxygenase